MRPVHRALAVALVVAACQQAGGFQGFDPGNKKDWEYAYPGNEIAIETCPDGHSCDTAAERLTKQGWILVAYGRARPDVGSDFAYVWRRPKPTPTPRPTPIPTPEASPEATPTATPSDSPTP